MEEGTVEQKPQTQWWQRWKRILLIIILFSILAGSLIYYVIPRVLTPPLRKDPIPSDAYIIPWMKPTPSIWELSNIGAYAPPWDIGDVMSDALKLDITFKIATLNETRVIPSTVFLGHDLEYLYVGGEFRAMYRNPASNSTLTLPNFFNMFFDVANDGVLKKPESGSEVSVFMNEGADWHTRMALSYYDLVWSYSSFLGRMYWLFGDDYYFPNAAPTLAWGGATMEYDNSTGTLFILFSRHLSRPSISEINGLQMRPGERWVMGFLLELGYATRYAMENPNFVDGWPKKTYPYLDNDASWWPKLAIDLSNPPPEFST